MLAVHGHGRADLALAVDDVMPPVVTPRNHVGAVTEAVDHEDVLDGGRVRDRGIRVVLEADLLAPPPAAVRGDQDLGATVVDPARERFGREPAEDHGMGSADAGAGKHGDRQLGDHRHVDRHAVALADAQLEQRVGGLAALPHEIRVGERARVARLADPVVGHAVTKAAFDMAVDAVVRHVELAAGEPRRVGKVPLEGLAERREPGQPLLGLPLPEADVVRVRLRVEGSGGIGLGGEARVGRKRPRLGKEVLDLRPGLGLGVDAHGSLQQLTWVAPFYADHPRPITAGRTEHQRRGAPGHPGAHWRAGARVRRGCLRVARTRLRPTPGRGGPAPARGGA